MTSAATAACEADWQGMDRGAGAITAAWMGEWGEQISGCAA